LVVTSQNSANAEPEPEETRGAFLKKICKNCDACSVSELFEKISKNCDACSVSELFEKKKSAKTAML
jgi:uncharacterized protein (DUF983 family)